MNKTLKKFLVYGAGVIVAYVVLSMLYRGYVAGLASGAGD